MVVLGAAALAIPAARHLLEAPPAETHVDIVTPPTTRPESFALSPDGRRVAFVATADGRSVIHVRSLEDGSTRVFANTQNAGTPFWSPDSRSVAFVVQGTLKRLDLADSSVRPLTAAYGGGGTGSWGANDILVFARSSSGPIYRAPATLNVQATAVTTVSESQSGHVLPSVLPGGRAIVYLARGRTSESDGLYAVSLEGGTSKRLTDADQFPVVFAAGHLVFTRQGALVARPFDPATLEFTGEPFRIRAPLVTSAMPGETGSAGFAVSASPEGSIAVREVAAPRKRLVWLDRSGTELERVSIEGDFDTPSLSRDGQRLLLRRVAGGGLISGYATCAEVAGARLRLLGANPSGIRTDAGWPTISLEAGIPYCW